MKRMTFNTTAKLVIILVLAGAQVVMGDSTCKPLVRVTCRVGGDASQYILSLVNTQAGATQSWKVGETTWTYTWTYSMALADPCMLLLTEDLQKVRTGGGYPTPPVHEITNYLIPLADLNLAPLGTRIKLNSRVTQVIIATQHATIRRWYGDSPGMPLDAPVVYEAPVRFGRPDVDIFVASVSLENALNYVAPFCGATPSDPFRTR